MYPKLIDITSFAINGINGINFLGENLGDDFALGSGAGNIFNNSETAIVIGAPLANAQRGKVYVIGGPLKMPVPSSGNISISQAGNYFTYYFTITSSIAADMIGGSIEIFDVDRDGVDDIFCGSAATPTAYGSGYWIRGGEWLKYITTFDVGTLNGGNGCRFNNFFSVGDYCGYRAHIVKNMTGNDNNGFMISCFNAFSGLGAVIVVPYAQNFCQGGSFTAANLDGVAGTYYKGVVPNGNFGYTVTSANLRGNNVQDLIFGSEPSAAKAYIKFGPFVMGIPPILISNTDRVFTGLAADSSGNVVTNIGNIFEDGCDTLMIGAGSASELISWGGRIDVIHCGDKFPATDIVLPNDLNGSNGFSIVDSLAYDVLGGSFNRFLGDVTGDKNLDFTITAEYASRLNRKNAGVVALCFGKNPAFLMNNKTLLYQDLINAHACSEFVGTANEYIGTPSTVGINFWNSDSIADWMIASYVIGTLRVIYGDAAPILLSAPFLKNFQTCSSMIFNLTHFNASDVNDTPDNFIYDINISNGNVTLANDTTQSINAFNHFQFINNQILINRNCNGEVFSFNVGVKVIVQNVTKPAYLPLQPVTINPNLQVSFPPLTQGGNVRLNSSHLDVGCESGCSLLPASYNFNINGSSAFISMYPAIDVPVPSFSKADLLTGNVFLNSNNVDEQPELFVSVVDNSTGLIQKTTQLVPFMDIPKLVFNTWDMIQGINFTLSRSEANGTARYIPNPGKFILEFNASSIKNLQIFNYQSGPTLSFTLNDLDANQAGLNAGPDLPEGSARICSGTLCSPYQNIPVSMDSYEFAPRLYGINFNIAETQTRILSLSDFNYANLNIKDSPIKTLMNYNMVISEKQNIEFFSSKTKQTISRFTLDDVQQGLVLAKNQGAASTFKITLVDMSRNLPFGLSSSTIFATPAFEYIPTVVNNNFRINETNTVGNAYYFGTETLSANMSDPLNLYINVSTQTACIMDSSANPGSAMIPYVDLQNRLTRITTNGSSIPCSFNISFVYPNFGNFSYGPFAANVSFRDIPRVKALLVSCTQATDQSVQLTELNAEDNAGNPSGITVKWTNLVNAQLTLDKDGQLIPIDSHNLADIAANRVHFKPNNGAAAPSAVVQFIGNSGLSTQPFTISQSAKTLVFTITHPAPVISFPNAIIATQGNALPLSSLNIGINIDDPTVNTNSVSIRILTILNAWIQRTYFPDDRNNAINQYQFGESIFPNSDISFVPDGTQNTPVLCVDAVTPSNVSSLNGPQCPLIIFITQQQPPKILQNQLSIARDEELLITDEMLSGISGISQDPNPTSLEWEMDCQYAVLKTNSTGTVLPLKNKENFFSKNITQGNIRIQASDTNYAVSCSVIATNAKGFSLQPQQTTVNFEEIYRAPKLFINNFVLELGLDSYPMLNSYLSAADNSGNIGGKIYGFTQPSQMNFNISNLRGANLPSGYEAASASMIIPASTFYTLTLANVDPNSVGFNVSACNFAGECSPATAAIFNWQPSKNPPSSSGPSYSLLGGGTTAGLVGAGVVTFVGIFFRLFGSKINKYIDAEGLKHNPLIIAIYMNIVEQLRIATPKTCFILSDSKKGKYIHACLKIVAELQEKGVQTKCASNVKNSHCCENLACCCAKKSKETQQAKGYDESGITLLKEHDALGNPLLDETDVADLATRIFQAIKTICMKKRSACKKCCDLICSCRRDLEDTDILEEENKIKIVEHVLKDLRKDGKRFLMNQKEIADVGKPTIAALPEKAVLFSSDAKTAADVGVDIKREVSDKTRGSVTPPHRPETEMQNISLFAPEVSIFSSGERRVPG